MRIVSHLAVLFYVTMTMFLGVFLLLFVSHGLPQLYPINYTDILALVSVAFLDTKLRLILAAIAVGMIFINYIFMKAIADDHQRERTIAFDNPGGRVSVSLSALEDLTRRVIGYESDVKESRAYIRARKKTIDIAVRLVLNADVNIPDLTARLQDLVRRKIQDIIGLEETVNVRMHVAKISSPERKQKRGRDGEGGAEEPVVPFQGYRA